MTDTHTQVAGQGLLLEQRTFPFLKWATGTPKLIGTLTSQGGQLAEISFSFRSQHSFVKFIDVWFHQLLEKTDLEADTNMSQENLVTGSRGVCSEGVFSPTELEQPV